MSFVWCFREFIMYFVMQLNFTRVVYFRNMLIRDTIAQLHAFTIPLRRIELSI